jgi:hypothetical protein
MVTEWVERSALKSLINQLVEIAGGAEVDTGVDRPLVVVAGLGGSGRSQLLADLRTHWTTYPNQTPTALIKPRSIGGDDESPWPVMARIIADLSMEAPGYRIAFPRVVLAMIAREAPIPQTGDIPAQNRAIRERIISRWDHNGLLTLVGDCVRAAGKLPQVTNATGPEAADAAADVVAEQIVRRLRTSRLVAKGVWTKPLAWFGDQDRDRRKDPESALVDLSRQEVNYATVPSVAEMIDDLMMAAMLADIRESMAAMSRRSWHALALIDDGDTPQARAFLSAFVTARMKARSVEKQTGRRIGPDPIVVVTASGGALAAQLAPDGAGQPKARHDGTAVPHIGRTDSWRQFGLGNLTELDVQTLAGQETWPPTIGSDLVGRLVHRFSGGHDEATRRVLAAWSAQGPTMGQLGHLLQKTIVPETRQPLECYLLDRVVAALCGTDTADQTLREDLVTLSAATDLTEAGTLNALLVSPRQNLLLDSELLWSQYSQPLPPLPYKPADSPFTMPTMIRYLGLRALGRRTDGDTWTEVFTELRGPHATKRPGETPAQRQARLHHTLALDDQPAVVAELTELLDGTELDDVEWLTLFDHVTSTPDPRRVFQLSARSAKRSNIRDGSGAAVVDRLVNGARWLQDPQLTDRESLSYLRERMTNDVRLIANQSHAFLARAKHYTAQAARYA